MLTNRGLEKVYRTQYNVSRNPPRLLDPHQQFHCAGMLKQIIYHY